MSLISFTPLADGSTSVNAAATNTPLSTIYNDYNGNITDANISASAAIAQTKVSLISLGAKTATVLTTETTTSTSYVSLATTTDAVTVTVGASGMALVSISCNMQCSLASGNAVRMSFAASGANTISAGTAPYVFLYQTWTTNSFHEGGSTWLLTGLSAGSTVFAAKYKTDGGTGTFFNRNISVVPL